MRAFLAIFLLTTLSLALVTTTARADTITYAFAGEWEGSGNVTFSGTFSYETNWGTPTEQVYEGGTLVENVWRLNSGVYMDWSISYGGSTYTRGTGNGYEDFLDIVDHTAGSGADAFAVGGKDDGDQYFELWLHDSSGSALSSLAIPTSLALADYDGFDDTYVFFMDSTGSSRFGELTSLSAVPEPTTVLLLGVGVAGLGVLRRRRRG